MNTIELIKQKEKDNIEYFRKEYETINENNIFSKYIEIIKYIEQSHNEPNEDTELALLKAIHLLYTAVDIEDLNDLKSRLKGIVYQWIYKVKEYQINQLVS